MFDTCALQIKSFLSLIINAQVPAALVDKLKARLSICIDNHGIPVDAWLDDYVSCRNCD